MAQLLCKWLSRRPRDRSAGRSHRDRLHLRRWLRLEPLEARELLSGLHPDYLLFHHLGGGATPFGTSGPTGTTPAQIRHAYGFDQISFNNGTVAGDGSGTTIALVDAYDDPNIANDLHQFDLSFGLPDPTFTKVNQNGGSTMPAANGGWASEIALDVEWSHAIAPKAAILLVEANDNSYSNLFAAVSYAARQPGVVAVSMSWGGGEFSGETSYDSVFQTPSGHAGVTFVASSGDSGAPPSYPAVSPNVLAAGGTTLNLDASGNILGESAWSGSGGGISSVESQPSYQHGIVTQSSTRRTNPDVAYDADPNTGFPVYDSYNNGSAAPWSQFGGTSDAAPQWAALIAIADQGRALAGLGALDGPSQTLPNLYALSASDFHDITSGASTGSPNEPAGPGYDLVTGRGTPVANRIVADLVGAPSSSTSLNVSAPSGATAGVPFTLTVSAVNGSGAVVPSYSGTVHFTSSDPAAVLPADYTFTAADQGVHSFTVTLDTTGNQTITVTDTTGGATSGSASVTVSPNSASKLKVSAPPAATAGAAFTLTVSAVNGSGAVVPTYAGTVHFTSSDTAAVLPADYTFTAADQGVHSFTVTLKSAGNQTITVTDTTGALTAGSASVTVSPGAASKLVFSQQPSNASASAVITPAVTVNVLDAYGNLLTGDNTDQVTVALGNNPGNGTLGGTTTVTVSGGVATFSNLSVSNPGNGYTLTALSGTLTGATSASFNITAGSSGKVIEGFETSDTWYVVGGPATAYRAPWAAHDGLYGLDNYNGNDWIYRNDQAAQIRAGDTVSVWLQFAGSADGRAYFGFGASGSGTLSLVAAPNTGQLILQSNLGWGFTQLAAANMTYQPNHWYRLEVDWGTSGHILGRLFDSDGVTLLKQVTASTTTIRSGGIAFRAIGSDKYWDTVTATYGVNFFAVVASPPAGPGGSASWADRADFGGWTGGPVTAPSGARNTAGPSAGLESHDPAPSSRTDGSAPSVPPAQAALEHYFASGLSAHRDADGWPWGTISALSAGDVWGEF